MMTAEVISPGFFLLALLLWAVGAAGSFAFRRSDHAANLWGSTCAMLGAVAGLVSSVTALAWNTPFSLTWQTAMPFTALSFQVDALSAFFILVISLIALFASIYGVGYVRHYYGKYDIGTLGLYYNAFLAGMVMVVSAHNAVIFIVAWEVMSLASWLLVVYEHREPANVEAGSLYFIMTHVGTAFIILAFLLLYRATGSLDFGMMKANIAALDPADANAIFILALIGFGIKAGIIPLHIWLPGAHPAAPSHVSALMSGVMIKTGIFMYIRVFVDIMPAAPVWWGVTILIIGAVSSLLGVLYALTEHDIKKLLAYHSIENVGIILLGLGSALVFRSLGLASLAVIAMVAALFHTMNHAIFKSLLFFGAGSVIAGMHTRNIEEYGGLMRVMPYTGVFFLVGSMAISALPPFNGFFSEWMTFQSLFSGMSSNAVPVRWAFVLAGGALAFTGGLAAMCFVKAFGAAFLGRPRSHEAREAAEIGLAPRIGMALPAVLTLVVGVCAGFVTGALSDVARGVMAAGAAQQTLVAAPLTVGVENGFSLVSMPLVFAGIVAALGATWALVALVARRRAVTIARTWDCGSDLEPRMEITATGFSRSIISIFQGILKPTKQVSIEYHDEEMRYFQKTKTVELGVRDPYRRYLFQPMHAFTIAVSGHMKKIQSGNVNMYVLYILVMLIVLLLVATV